MQASVKVQGMPTKEKDSSSAFGAGWWWVQSYLLPALVVLLAIALQFHGLDKKSLWFDELGTLAGSGWRGSWLDAIRNPLAIPLTPKPPLSFVITRLFLVLDESVFVLRLQAVVFSTLAVALTYTLAKSFLNRRVGLMVAFLLAIAPLHLRYAQEARMYGLFGFLSLLSLYLFWRGLRSDRVLWWIGFAIAGILNLYTHLFAALPLAVLGLIGLWILIRRRDASQYPFQAWHFVFALMAIALLFLPMVPYVFRGLVSEEGLGGTAARDWNLHSLLGVLRQFSAGTDLGMVVYSVFLLLGSAVLLIRDRDVLILALAWIGLPIVLVLVTPFGHEARVRYFVFALPVYLMLVSCGLDATARWLTAQLSRLWPALDLRHEGHGWVMAGMLVFLAGIGAPYLLSFYGETKQNWRDAAQLVYSQAEPGDQILVPSLYQQVGVLFYADQWAGGTDPWTEADFHILPADLNKIELPLAEGRGYWLIAGERQRYLSGGAIDRRIQPHYRFSETTVFEVSQVPRDRRIIGSVSYGSVIVARIRPANPPIIRFWSDDKTIMSGDCTWLNWETENVREVSLEGEGIVGHGRREVCPSASTTYELEVTHRDDSVSQVTVEVSIASP